MCKLIIFILRYKHEGCQHENQLLDNEENLLINLVKVQSGHYIGYQTSGLFWNTLVS
jgi:hypothetical protein